MSATALETTASHPIARDASTVKATRTRKSRNRMMVNSVVVVFALLWIIPVYWMLNSAFQSDAALQSTDTSIFPTSPTLANFTTVLKDQSFWSALPSGTRCNAIATNVDFAATLLDMCGIDPEAALPTSQGRSFLPLMRGEQIEDWPVSMYYRYWEHDDPHHHVPAHYGVRTRHHKLVRYYGDPLGVPGTAGTTTPDEWELFDLDTDPQELTNVVDDPGYASVRRDLEAELARLQTHYADLPYEGPDTPHPDWARGLQEHS